MTTGLLARQEYAEAVVRSPPDGYTLALMGLPSAINVTLYENVGFNLTRDKKVFWCSFT